jgi:hypothetical protein
VGEEGGIGRGWGVGIRERLEWGREGEVERGGVVRGSEEGRGGNLKKQRSEIESGHGGARRCRA